MRDKNAGKYQKLYKQEFDDAGNALSGEAGVLEWGIHDYQAFVFRNHEVVLIFYPHRTTAGNYHIRVRSQGSKNISEANRLMRLLDNYKSEYCTFTFNEAK